VVPAIGGMSVASREYMVVLRRLMTPVETSRTIARELVAVGRNYRYVAVLRRQLRSEYGLVVVRKPSVLIGEALLAMDHMPWTRLAMPAALVAVVLVAVATRIRFS
jgi:hypothetical protein